jgi:hypothetical protein
VSKTLASILTVAAIVAVQAIPGVGQAIGGAIAGTIGIGATSAATAAAIAQIAVVGLGAIAQALLPSGAAKPAQTETAIKSPRPPRVSGYGEGRQHMAFALYVTDNSGTAIDVGPIHDGKIQGITRHYLGDTRVTVLPDGRVQGQAGEQFGRDSDIVKIYTRLGEANETAFGEVVSRIPDQWTYDHRGDGIVTGAVLSASVRADIYQKIYPTGGPNSMPLSLAMQRQLVFDWRDPSQTYADPRTWKYSENAVLALAHYELVRKAPPPTRAPSDPGYWLEIGTTYSARWQRLFAPTIAYWTAAANDADTPVALKGVQTILAEKADDGSGHLTLNSINGLSVGQTIVISATGDTSLTETRTVTSIAGMVIGLSSPLSNDHPVGSQVSWSSSAGSPATELRYRTCVAHEHTDAHKGVIANLLACFDGWIAPRSDGALVVYSGRYYVPTVTIGPDQILSYSLQDGVEEESALNQIAVTYVSANHDYNVVDTDAWEDGDDIQKRGKVLADQLSNQVPSHSQGRRLAKRKMSQIMAGMRGSVETNAEGRAALGQRYIRLRIVEAGVVFLDATVEIVSPVKRNMMTGGLTFTWILADPNIDAWNPATEEGDPAPVGNRIAPAPLADPEIADVTLRYDQDSGTGTAGVRLLVDVAGPLRSDATWFVRWRADGDASWIEQQHSDVDLATSVSLLTGFVPANRTVHVEVAYSVGDGRVSEWSDDTSVSTRLRADTDRISADSNTTRASLE